MLSVFHNANVHSFLVSFYLLAGSPAMFLFLIFTTREISRSRFCAASGPLCRQPIPGPIHSEPTAFASLASHRTIAPRAALMAERPKFLFSPPIFRPTPLFQPFSGRVHLVNFSWHPDFPTNQAAVPLALMLLPFPIPG